LKEIVVATRNLGKVGEIRALVERLGIEVRSLAEIDQHIEIVEDGATFADNALKKAMTVVEAIALPVLADDSGLEVDILGGRPGVRSARYGGEELDDTGRCQRLLTEMFVVPHDRRQARFRCALAYIEPGAEPVLFHGVLEGRIAPAPQGIYGFGYDPIFIPEGYEERLAELRPAVKNRISHRAKALQAFIRWVEARRSIIPPPPPPGENTP
jgi:XTP/dITP diphosphohydrolase